MVSRSSLWEESDTPPLRPPLPACPQGDLWVVTQIPQPTSRSAAEGSNVPGLQPKPGRAITPIQPGSDAGICSWEAPARPMGRIAWALPTPPWHTQVQTPINHCPGLPGEPLPPQTLTLGKGTVLMRLTVAANGRWGAQVPLPPWGRRRVQGGLGNVWIHSRPLHKTLPSVFAWFLPVRKP